MVNSGHPAGTIIWSHFCSHHIGSFSRELKGNIIDLCISVTYSGFIRHFPVVCCIWRQSWWQRAHTKIKSKIKPLGAMEATSVSMWRKSVQPLSEANPHQRHLSLSPLSSLSSPMGSSPILLQSPVDIIVYIKSTCPLLSCLWPAASDRLINESEDKTQKPKS